MSTGVAVTEAAWEGDAAGVAPTVDAFCDWQALTVSKAATQRALKAVDLMVVSWLG
ncbi:hypothetical protein ABFW14_07685 [Mycolicibacterium fortuitum]|uniref:hypothetical protein n=1 Tax=Mycolicibacterium TaxID=1866885 RepID=UPI0013F4E03F|nr:MULTISPECIES: hypothetical protein [Mycolicibacterium]NOP95203.1 hypothetical protein [Mycolicibacterium fortuitum]UBV16264.1 hypothetical protein H8Z57_05225 [Mycolicibacterium fortuitum]